MCLCIVDIAYSFVVYFCKHAENSFLKFQFRTLIRAAKHNIADD